MYYENTMVGTFLSRPNRFLAHVMLNGKEIVCHVKNTGRLKELLLPGVPVVVQHHPDAAALGRKTEYSLIKVAKPAPTERPSAFLSETNHVAPEMLAKLGIAVSEEIPWTWVNIDSQAPNQVAFEWLSEGEGLPFCPRPQNIRREVHYGDSRFDLSFTDCGQPWLMEVKGVTLDVNGTAKFPDAPTERGIKHLDELVAAVKDGFCAAVLFVIQMKGISAFSPNAATHPEFAEALTRAKKNGVHVWAYDCVVTEDTLRIDRPVQVDTHHSHAIYISD